MKTSIMFTALPNGRLPDGRVRLSLFVSPRLTPGPGEGLAGPFVDWPAVLRAGLSFRVLFGTPDRSAVAALLPGTTLPDSTLWLKLFSVRTPVTPFALRDYRSSSVASFSARTVADTVRGDYKDVAAASSTRPILGRSSLTASPLASRVSEVAAAAQQTKRGGAAIVPRVGQEQPTLSKAAVARAVPSVTTPAGKELLRSSVFYNRGDWRKELRVAEPPRVAPPVPDFHAILGCLGDHPALLRRLGIILDLVVQVPAGITGEVDVAVIPNVTAGGSLPAALAGVEILRPWTYANLTADGLWPFYNGNEITPNGLLALDSPIFHVDDLDVDHAAMEFIDFAEKTQQELAGGGDVEAVFPALRTLGLAAYRDDREAQAGDHFNRPYTIQNNPSGLRFVADEIVRGYRVDVQRDGGPWTSLCKRVSRIDIADSAIVTEDEGFLKGSSLTAVSDDGQPILNVHESLFSWSGWSLVAQRPGKAVTAVPQPNNHQGETAAWSPNAATKEMNLPIAIDIKAKPGSLPRLRFGSSYRFRVRAVDLAGNDLSRRIDPVAATSEDHASTPVNVKRYEPVSPATLVLRSALTEGESVEHLVIRSNPYGATPLDPSAYAAWANTLTGDASAPGPMGTYAATCERHVAPPKVAYQLAEQHGAFDGILTAPVTRDKAQRAYDVALKEEGTFLDLEVTDTTSATYGKKSTSRTIVTPPAARMPDGSACPYQGTAPVPRGEALGHGQYVIHPAVDILLPYLPDPNAAAFSLRGVTEGTLQRPFAPREAGGDWPEIGVFRIALAGVRPGDAIGATGIDASGTARAANTPVTVSLPPATLLHAKYSSAVKSPSLMALTPAGQEALVARGEHQMLSPARRLTLVHAVQQPKSPTWQNLALSVPERSPGETSSRVVGTFTVDGPSSAHVDVVAEWDETIDSAASDTDPSKTPLPQRGTLASLPLAYDAEEVPLPEGLVQFFGDTKRRTVRYQAVATTRYREYFPPCLTRDAANITNASAPLTRTIRSTARPPVPKVLYVVPTFKWVDTLENGAPKRARVGGGLRVYVDRGWFATGEDERLAVLVAPKEAPGLVSSDLVSVWGNDPIWSRTAKIAALDEDHLGTEMTNRDRYTVLKNLAPAEDPSKKVTALTFKPQWHAERKLWYFDIELKTDAAYFPFVRLALARVQPESVADLHLSAIVRTDFVQLVADRAASVVDLKDDTFAVSLMGPTGSNFARADGAPAPTAREAASGHLVTVEFQESLSARGDDLDWKTLDTGTVIDPTLETRDWTATSTVTFRGVLPFPVARATPGARHRVLFKEFEIYQADAQAGVARAFGAVHAGTDESIAYQQRLVYSAAVEVPR